MNAPHLPVTASASLRFRILAGHAIPLVLMVAVSLVVDGFLRLSNETTDAVRHGHLALERATELIKSVVDAESGLRGFVITGDVRFLEPYYDAVETFESRSEVLRRPFRSRPDQAAHVERLNVLFRRWLDEVARPEIALRQAGKDGELASEMVRSGVGRALVGEMRRVIDQVIETERAELVRRKAVSARAIWEGRIVALAGPALVLALALGITLAIVLRLAKGVRSVAEAAAGIAAGDLTRRAAVFGTDEAAIMSTAFNRMAARLEARTREAERLHRLVEILPACLTPQEAHAVVEHWGQELLPGTQGAVLEVNASRSLLAVAARWGQEPLGEEVHAVESCWALRRGRVHVSGLGPDDPVCGHLGGGRVSMCLPLSAQGETIGVLCVQNAAGAGAFGEAERRVATMLSEQLGLTLASVRLRERLRERSIRDPLTGLYNRRHLDEVFERELLRAARTGQPLGVMILDIDHFKRFNDTFGHEAGDAVLREVGKLMLSMFRGSDLPCRLGGEEFVAVLPEASLEGVAARAEELRAAVQALVVLHGDGSLGPVTASLGVATAPLHGTDAETLLRVADAALYRAKQTGRNRVVVAEMPAGERAAAG